MAVLCIFTPMRCGFHGVGLVTLWLFSAEIGLSPQVLNPCFVSSNSLDHHTQGCVYLVVVVGASGVLVNTKLHLTLHLL